jgi:hypothetical protein
MANPSSLDVVFLETASSSVEHPWSPDSAMMSATADRLDEDKAAPMMPSFPLAFLSSRAPLLLFLA